MDQSRAINGLAPFIALAKSANSPRAAADLVTQATSAANTYVFAELLEQPNVKALASNEQYGKFHTLLEIFAWGTLETYEATPDLPPLSDTQLQKLRLLSLLTIASHGKQQQQPTSPSASNLSYTSLITHLRLPSPAALESLITTAIYADLLTGTLNPALQTVVITSVAPLRDLAPGSVGAMITELARWSARCSAVLADLEGEIQSLRAASEKRAAREARTERQVKSATEALGRTTGGGGPGGAQGQSGAMDARLSGGARAERRDQGFFGGSDDLDAMDVDGVNANANALGSGGGKKKSGGGGVTAMLAQFQKSGSGR